MCLMREEICATDTSCKKRNKKPHRVLKKPGRPGVVFNPRSCSESSGKAGEEKLVGGGKKRWRVLPREFPGTHNTSSHYLLFGMFTWGYHRKRGRVGKLGALWGKKKKNQRGANELPANRRTMQPSNNLIWGAQTKGTQKRGRALPFAGNGGGF